MVRAFGQRTAAQYIELVKKNDSSLVTLDLTSNASFKMKAVENLKELAAGLKTNTVITQLVLRECDVNDEGAEALGEALAANHTIEQLDLQSNRITTDGVIALTLGLASNKGVRSINLLDQAARFGDDCVEAFIDVFFTNITLNKIMWQIESNRSWELSKQITRNVELQKRQQKGEDITVLLPKALGGQGGYARVQVSAGAEQKDGPFKKRSLSKIDMQLVGETKSEREINGKRQALGDSKGEETHSKTEEIQQPEQKDAELSITGQAAAMDEEVHSERAEMQESEQKDAELSIVGQTAAMDEEAHSERAEMQQPEQKDAEISTTGQVAVDKESHSETADGQQNEEKDVEPSVTGQDPASELAD